MAAGLGQGTGRGVDTLRRQTAARKLCAAAESTRVCEHFSAGVGYMHTRVLEHTRGIGVARALTLRQGNGARGNKCPEQRPTPAATPALFDALMGLSLSVFSIKKRGTCVPLCWQALRVIHTRALVLLL